MPIDLYMAKVSARSNAAGRIIAHDKNPPLFPSAAAAIGAEFDFPVSLNEPRISEKPEPLPMPGVGCLWCWQVAAVGDGDKGLMPSLQDILPRSILTALHLGQAQNPRDYLDIEGGDSFPTVSADWSFPSEEGLLCIRAPLFFDVWNASGSKVWGRAAQGCIVVARRGSDFFEVTARNAESAGAVALVILDDRQEWDDDYEMTLETDGPPPRIPAVLVPKRAESLLTGATKQYAVIARR